MVSALRNTTETFSKNVANGFMFVLEVPCQCHNSTVGFLQIPCCLIPEYICKRFNVNEDLKCNVVVLIKKQFILL